MPPLIPIERILRAKPAEARGCPVALDIPPIVFEPRAAAFPSAAPSPQEWWVVWHPPESWPLAVCPPGAVVQRLGLVHRTKVHFFQSGIALWTS